jgi:hypothetical protein
LVREDKTDNAIIVVSGVGPLTAVVTVAAIGDVGAFKFGQKLAV